MSEEYCAGGPPTWITQPINLIIPTNGNVEVVSKLMTPNVASMSTEMEILSLMSSSHNKLFPIECDVSVLKKFFYGIGFDVKKLVSEKVLDSVSSPNAPNSFSEQPPAHFT